MELERGKNLDYWNDVTILVEDELRKSKKMKKQSEFEGEFENSSNTTEAVTSYLENFLLL